MGYENPFMDMDEDGEPLMDPDSPFDGDGSPERAVDPVSDDDEDDWRRERSPTPVFGGSTVDEDKVGKPRKRLVKKGGKEGSPGLNGSPASVGGGLDDWGEEEEEEQQQPTSSSKKRKEVALKEGKGSGSGGKEKRRKSSSSSLSKVDRSGGKVSRSGEKG